MKLLRAILQANWLIEPTEAQKYMPFVAALLQGKSVQLDSASGTMRASDSFAHIGISGPLIKEDGYCGEPGMATLARHVAAAAADDNVKGIILHVSSPGGSVDGTEALAKAVKDADAKKPVIAVVDGMAASAAYWIASAAREIYAETQTSFVGSIGVMSTLRDYSAYLSAMGIAEHRIYADQSQDKNKDYEDALKGETKLYKEQVLNPIAELFINTVRTNRPQVKDTALSGRTFIASEAITQGLIDGYGDAAFAESRIDELISNSNSNSNPDSNMSNKSRWAGLAAFLGLSALLADKPLNSSDLDRLESLTNENDALQSKVDDLQKQIGALTKERDDFKAKADALGKEPGDVHRKPVAKEPIATLDKNEPEAETPWDDPNAFWNKRVDANPFIRK